MYDLWLFNFKFYYHSALTRNSVTKITSSNSFSNKTKRQEYRVKVPIIKDRGGFGGFEINSDFFRPVKRNIHKLNGYHIINFNIFHAIKLY